MQTLEDQRAEFIRKSGRFLAFPLAGAISWLLVAIAASFLEERTAIYVLLFSTGAIFPLALAIAKVTDQQVFQKGNPFASLMGLSVLMVNLMWVLHFVLLFRFPSVAVLSIALALGLHWIVFGWIIQSSVGIIHALLRTALCTAAFLLLPTSALSAVSAAVVACYLITIVQLSTHQVGSKNNT